jgi:hypothetical protein
MPGGQDTLPYHANLVLISGPPLQTPGNHFVDRYTHPKRRPIAYNATMNLRMGASE